MNQRGFTLPELLVVIAITTAVALGTFLLIHPKNFDEQSRDAERRTGIAIIVQALNRYYANEGRLPASITTKQSFIGSGSGNIDLCKDLVPGYISDLPLDPIASAQTTDGKCNADGQKYLTGYTVWRSQDGKTVNVAATKGESAAKAISISHTYGK